MNKYFLWCWIVIPLLLSACAQTRSTTQKLRLTRVEKKDLAAQKIATARALYDTGDVEAAASSLRAFVDNNPYDPSQDEAYELIVEWLLQLKKHEEAKRVASYFLSHHEKSPSAKKIIGLFSIEPTPLKKPDQRDEEIEQRELFEENPEGKVPDDLIELEEAVSNATSELKTKTYQKLAEFVFEKASIALAAKIVQKKVERPSLGLFGAKLAIYHYHLSDLEKALQFALFAQNKVPEEQKTLVNTLIHEIDEAQKVDMKSIGILLPLSGPFAPFGKKTLMALSLGFQIPLETRDEEIKVFKLDGINIVVADSKGDPENISRMVKELIIKHKVALIIGEITNESSLLSAQMCQRLQVPMLSLSRHPLLPDLGDYIFAFNASQSQQIKKLIDYAIDIKGHKRFAILFPRHNYGMSMTKMFFDGVISRGGTVTALEAYDAHETNFLDPVKKLLGKYYLAMRPEYIECEKKHKTKQETAKKCKDFVHPIVDFDALFIPEFQKLALVIPALIHEDLLVSNSPTQKTNFSLATKIENPQYVQLLGANSWNDKSIISKLSNQINGAYFVDSISFLDEDLKKFAASFFEKSNNDATTLEVFAFDVAKLALKILDTAHERTTRQNLRDEIANFRGKVGLLPHIAFLKNGELDAPEVGFEIHNGLATSVLEHAQPKM